MMVFWSSGSRVVVTYCYWGFVRPQHLGSRTSLSKPGVPWVSLVIEPSEALNPLSHTWINGASELCTVMDGLPTLHWGIVNTQPWALEVIFFTHNLPISQKRCECIVCWTAVNSLNSFKDFVAVLWFGISSVESSFPRGGWGIPRPFPTAATMNLAPKGTLRAGQHPAFQKSRLCGLNLSHHHFHIRLFTQ